LDKAENVTTTKKRKERGYDKNRGDIFSKYYG
jgi:hypothetical protein